MCMLHVFYVDELFIIYLGVAVVLLLNGVVSCLSRTFMFFCGLLFFV